MRLPYVISTPLEAGALGWIALIANAVALLAALALLLNAPRIRPRRPLRTLYWSLGVAVLALAVAAALVAVLFRRAQAFILKPGEPPLWLSGESTSYLELQALNVINWQAEATLQLTAYAALGASCLVVLAAILTRIGAHTYKKLRARRLLPWTAALAGAELTGAIAVAVLRRSSAIDVHPHCFAECREEVPFLAAQVLGDARLHVAIATGVAFFLLTRALRRAADAGHRPIGPRASAGSIALFGLGLLAFASTRAMAFDATHPLPKLDLDETCPYTRIDERSLPPAPVTAPEMSGEGARPWGRGPTLDLAPPCANIDGSCVIDPPELASIVSTKRALWRQIQPHHPMPPVLIAASSDAPLASLAPWLLELRRAGFAEIEILLARPPEFAATETLGLVERTPRCAGVRARLDDIELSVAQGFTWGDLSASLLAR